MKVSKVQASGVQKQITPAPKGQENKAKMSGVQRRISYDIVLRPLVSEKSVENIKGKKYAFEVAVNATKPQIKKAVEEAFGVKVEKVNTINYDGKMKRQGKHEGRTGAWKKAYAQLSKDSKAIEFFESLQ